MALTRILAKILTNPNNKNSFCSKLRVKRVATLVDMIEATYSKHGVVEILDIGGTEVYWEIIEQQFLVDHNVKITILNIPGSDLPSAHGLFAFVEGDGCDLKMYSDKAFHIAHSNSVVEHVGDWTRMRQFSNELRRVSIDYFVQTPNYWFPVEPHCFTPLFHWLPKPMRVFFVRNLQLGHWKKASSIDEAVETVESARLLNKKMLEALFSDAKIITERLFFLPKSFIAVKFS